MAKPKFLSPEWWQDKTVSNAWCEHFCQPFYAQDPSLLADKKTHESVGIIFFNRPNGDIIPAGFTALQNGNFIFQYHLSYLANPSLPPLSDTLPKQKGRFVAQHKMLPFFDNLPAEGWFGKAQSAALGDTAATDSQDTHMDGEPLEQRYHRFMMFGRDYPGAVWATYIRADPALEEQSYQSMIAEALRSRSSIAGVQPKLLGVKTNGELHPANFWETSTHIVKLAPQVSAHMPWLMEYEYMSILATKKLLPKDKCVDASLTDLHLRDGSTREVLAVKRFDRTPQGNKIHFEEINQLLGKQNSERYRGSYADIAKVIDKKIGHEGVKQFYARLLCQFLLGNTDNHMKNFALFYDNAKERWQMTPDYDLAPTVNYHVSTLALHATEYRERGRGDASEGEETYNNLSPKVLVTMGQKFGLSVPEVTSIIHDLRSHIADAKAAVNADPSPRLDVGSSTSSSKTIRQDFSDRIDGREKQLFGTLDKYLQYRKGGPDGARKL